MNNEKFEEILENRIRKIRSTLAKKADEYAGDNDRLYNFKRAAKMNGESPAEALWGMASKHIISVIDLVEGKLSVTEKNVNEKIGDGINYFILLEAIFKEEANYD